jgi:hypothetical protein
MRYLFKALGRAIKSQHDKAMAGPAQTSEKKGFLFVLSRYEHPGIMKLFSDSDGRNAIWDSIFREVRQEGTTHDISPHPC